MAYIKKNVSLVLLLLVILILSSLAGITAYYQFTYKNLSNSYQQKVNEANLLSSNLTFHETALNQTVEELQTKKADLSKFDTLYTNLTVVNTQLRGTLAQTKADLDRSLGELASTKDRLAQVQAQLQTAQVTIAAQSSQISNLQSERDSLSTQVSQKNAEICSLKQQLGQTC